MGVFKFKRFEVVNERSAMKVNTDGVLLGAAMTIKPSDRHLLDIGTGTGTIALMAAQRWAEMAGDVFVRTSDGGAGVCDVARIDAVDIDEPSATEAAANFKKSPWAELLFAHHMSLAEFQSACDVLKYDLIFSNPPYFDNALQAPEERRNAARHTATGLSYREILDFAATCLTEQGRVALVLPYETEHELTRHARMCGLHLSRIMRVRTVPRKAPIRIIAEFSRERNSSPEDKVLTVQENGQYTQEYLSIMKDFYLFA